MRWSLLWSTFMLLIIVVMSGAIPVIIGFLKLVSAEIRWLLFAMVIPAVIVWIAMFFEPKE